MNNDDRHLNHDWYVRKLVDAQKVGDSGMFNSLWADLAKMRKSQRDAIKSDFRAKYKKWYDSQSGARRLTTKNPRVAQMAKVEKSDGYWIVKVLGPRGWIVGGEWLTKAEAEADAKLYRKNPMRKKKRSAKQLANDRRLGRMAKARAKTKRGGRRKVSKRKNPHRKIKALKTPAKSHLWLVFKCKGRSVYFLVLRGGKPGWSLTKGEAILFRTKQAGKTAGRNVATKRGMAGWGVGVAPSEMTAPQIANRCEGKA